MTRTEQIAARIRAHHEGTPEHGLVILARRERDALRAVNAASKSGAPAAATRAALRRLIRRLEGLEQLAAERERSER